MKSKSVSFSAAVFALLSFSAGGGAAAFGQTVAPQITPPVSAPLPATEGERGRAKAEAEVAEARAKARLAPSSPGDDGATAALLLARQLGAAERTAQNEHVAFEALSWVGVPRYQAGANELQTAIDAPHFVEQVFARAQVPLGLQTVVSGEVVHWNKPGEVKIGDEKTPETLRTLLLGSPPDLSVLNPGDLVFYGQSGSPFDKQVGIYVGRVREIAHACVLASVHKGTVVVENMDAPENTGAYRYTLRVSGDMGSAAAATNTTPATGGGADAATAWMPTGNVFLLAVGANRYDRDALNLQTPAAGAEMFAAKLSKTFSAGTRKTTTVVKTHPTKREFLDAVSSVCAKAGSDDLFVLYYKGRAEPSKLYPNGKLSESVDMSELTNTLLQVPAGRILVIFDASSVSLSGTDWKKLGASNKVVMQWAASQKNETALEDTFGKADPNGVPLPGGTISANGVFTYYLLSALSGVPSDDNDTISAAQIAQKVIAGVKKDTVDLQQPVFAATGGGRDSLPLDKILLFRRPKPTEPKVAQNDTANAKANK